MNFLKSKTVLFGSLVTAFGGLQMALPSVEALVSPTMYGGITAAIGAVVIVLRFLTTLPVDQK